MCSQNDSHLQGPMGENDHTPRLSDYLRFKIRHVSSNTSMIGTMCVHIIYRQAILKIHKRGRLNSLSDAVSCEVTVTCCLIDLWTWIDTFIAFQSSCKASVIVQKLSKMFQEDREMLVVTIVYIRVYLRRAIMRIDTTLSMSKYVKWAVEHVKNTITSVVY